MNNKKTMIFGIILGALLVIWVAYGFLSTWKIEQPKYEVLEKNDTYEVREYGKYIVAETEVDESYDTATNSGFMLVADYIFGNNTAKEKIAMTSPVVQEESQKIAMTTPVIQESRGASTYVIQFVLPSKYQMEDLPEPNNKNVKLREVDGRKLAVHRFNWFTPLKRVTNKKEMLVNELKANKIEVVGDPILARYNPPWTPPFMRRNEIWVEIK